MLWRREPWGYVLGGLLLTKATTTGLSLAFTSSLAIWWAGTVDAFQVVLALLFGLMALLGLALLGLALLVPYLSSAGTRKPAAPRRPESEAKTQPA